MTSTWSRPATNPQLGLTSALVGAVNLILKMASMAVGLDKVKTVAAPEDPQPFLSINKFSGFASRFPTIFIFRKRAKINLLLRRKAEKKVGEGTIYSRKGQGQGWQGR